MNKFTKCLATGCAVLAAAGGCWLVNTRTEKATIQKFQTVQVATTRKLRAVANKSDTASNNAAIFKTETVAEAKPAFSANGEIPLEPWLQFKLQEICRNNGIPFTMALGVIEQESCFVTDAENDGCYGLMQVSTIHAPKEVLLNPVDNMRLGCGLLSTLYHEYGDWHKALVCYNCGEGGAYDYYFQYGKFSSEYSRAVILRAAKWASKLGK